jgi:hypothetical protein
VVGGVSVGVGVGGGIGAGAGADEDLEAAVLGARHGAGGSRPAAVSVRQVSRSALLCSAGARARAFLESGGGTGRQWMAALLLLRSGLFACGCACAPLHGVFNIFLELEASSLLGPSAALSAPSQCVSFSRLD